MEKLVDMLPKTTETLILMLYEDDKEMFEDLVVLTEERLPNLKRIGFEDASLFDETLIEDLKKIGIKISSREK